MEIEKITSRDLEGVVGTVEKLKGRVDGFILQSIVDEPGTLALHLCRDVPNAGIADTIATFRVSEEVLKEFAAAVRARL